MADKHPLKIHRDEHGLSQTALGKELDVSMQTIWRWEHGVRSPRKQHLARIKERLGIEPADIVKFDVARAAEEAAA